MIGIFALAAATVTATPTADALTASIFDEICLKAFPDDAAVRAAIAARHGEELPSEAVKVTMGNDPAVGWILPSERVSVWLEFPPFHACSVRWNAPVLGTLESYSKVIETFKSTRPGFLPTKPMEAVRNDIHIRLTGEQRILPDRSTESLMVVDQHIANPARRAAGETGYVIRFVHQFAPPSTGD